MIIAGAKGFAKELLELLVRDKNMSNIVFFDNINQTIPNKLFKQFNVIKDLEVLDNINDNQFCLGVGTPKARKILFDIFIKHNKKSTTIIANSSRIGNFGTEIGEACCIMDYVVITNDVKLGKACLINIGCTIGHDTVIGDFCEISPNVSISGRCIVGSNCSIGTGAVIIPNITIGDNCIIGAGTVVTKNIPDNSVVVGVPGKVIKTNNE